MILKLIPQIKLTNGVSSRYEPIYILENQRYGFRFYKIITELFNSDSDAWVFDLFDPTTNENTLTGIRLAVGVNLLYPYRYKGESKIPPGILYVNDLRIQRWDLETNTFIDQAGFDPEADEFLDGLYEVLYATSDEFF